MRDLFLYGDQFVANAGANVVQLPAIDANANYVVDHAAACDALFVNQDGTKQHTEQDGLISLVVAGSQRDYTTDNRSSTLA